MAKFLSPFKSLYFIFRQYYLLTINSFLAHEVVDFKQIPIIINNYNRLSCLLKLISVLESKGYHNIHILDNNSSYQPLLDYYKSCPYKVYRFSTNFGYLSFWKSGIYKEFHNQYFVYTDSDVVPIDTCPDDFMQYFYQLMKKYPRASKVGFGLSINDLPDYFKDKQKVMAWEQQFWQKKLEKDVYRAPIDTTFALYRPNVKGGAYFHDFMIRTGGAYIAKHLPWYNNSNNLSDEDQFYLTAVSTSTHWSALQNKE